MIKKIIIPLMILLMIPLIFSDTLDTRYERGLVNQGDPARIEKIFEKGFNGETITVGVIGGSITQGSLASDYNNAYGKLVSDWWTSTFSQSQVDYVNAGIGATMSLYGAHRVKDHLLNFNPDFVIVEYAVNDRDDYLYSESMEGLIRQILKKENSPAVLMLFMMRNDSWNAQDFHIPVGLHYDLPMISYRDALKPEIDGGTLIWSTISSDKVHPNDVGHGIAADLVKKFLSDSYNTYTGTPSTIGNIPSPLYSNVFENVKRFNVSRISPTMNNGWQTTSQGWYSSAVGSILEFDFEGQAISIRYKKGLNKGKVEVYVDNIMIKELDGNFSYSWWNPTDLIIKNLAQGDHKLKIKLMQGPNNQGNDFYVLEILPAGVNNAPVPTLTITPAPSSTLTGSSETFTWEEVTDATDYWLWAGPCNDDSWTGCGDDHYNSGSLGTSLTATANGLPTDGSTVYVRLWYNDGSWKSMNFSYVASSGGGGVGAKELWVDVDSIGGNDCNDGISREQNSKSTPFCSIQAAANVTEPGDNVTVRDGVYTDPDLSDNYDAVVSLWRSGTSNEWITFKSENKWGAVIDGNAQTVGFGFLISWAASYVRIEDFEVKDLKGTGLSSNSESSHIYYYRNKIHDISSNLIAPIEDTYGRSGAFDGKGTSFHTYDSNIFYNNGRKPHPELLSHDYNHDHGIYTYGINVVIINNIFSNHEAGWGIQTTETSNHVKIINNTFNGPNPYSKGQLILWGQVSNTLIQNNIFYNPRDYAIDCLVGENYPLNNITLINNLVSQVGLMVGTNIGTPPSNLKCGYSLNDITEEGSITDDFEFISIDPNSPDFLRPHASSLACRLDGTWIGAVPCETTTCHDADLDCNGCVEQGELLTYTNLWFSGTPGVIIELVGGAIEAWQSCDLD